MFSLTFGARKSFFFIASRIQLLSLVFFFPPNYVVKVFPVALSVYIEDQTKHTPMFKGVNPWNQNQRPLQDPNQPEAKTRTTLQTLFSFIYLSLSLSTSYAYLQLLPSFLSSLIIPKTKPKNF